MPTEDSNQPVEPNPLAPESSQSDKSATALFQSAIAYGKLLAVITPIFVFIGWLVGGWTLNSWQSWLPLLLVASPAPLCFFVLNRLSPDIASAENAIGVVFHSLIYGVPILFTWTITAEVLCAVAAAQYGGAIWITFASSTLTLLTACCTLGCCILSLHDSVISHITGNSKALKDSSRGSADCASGPTTPATYILNAGKDTADPPTATVKVSVTVNDLHLRTKFIEDQLPPSAS